MRIAVQEAGLVARERVSCVVGICLKARSGEGSVVLWGEKKRIWQKRRDFSKPRGKKSEEGTQRLQQTAWGRNLRKERRDFSTPRGEEI